MTAQSVRNVRMRKIMADHHRTTKRRRLRSPGRKSARRGGKIGMIGKRRRSRN